MNLRIIWLCNIVFPEAMALLNNKSSEIKSTGGWLIGAASSLSNDPKIELTVVSLSSDVQEIRWLKGIKTKFVLLPSNRKSIHNSMDEILTRIKPDIVHIHGTESVLGAIYLQYYNSSNVVLSIQGLPSEIAKYHHSGMSCSDIFKNLTIHDILRGSIWSGQREMYKLGEREKKMLRKVKYVIGRTSFDHAHSWSINSNIKYYLCNETLRADFFDGLWSYERCVKYSLFMSQAQAPIKGLHYMLKALFIVKQHYPNVQLRIAGEDMLRGKGFSERVRLRGYGKYIKHLLRKFNLAENVHFIGPQDASQMKEEMLKSNVFVCPSTIENSPNSLCEAQLLGVPCIASYVGGVPDFIPNNEYGLVYRFDDCDQLAYNICQYFESSMQYNPSIVHELALQRHNSDVNSRQTLEIYRQIIEFNKA